MFSTSPRPSAVRRALRTLSVAAAALLLATACGQGEEDQAQDPSAAPTQSAGSAVEPAGQGEGAGDVEALAGVDVTLHGDQAPEVSLDGPVQAEEVSSRVLTEGEGDQYAQGDLVRVKTAVVDPETGEVLAHNYDTPGEAIALDPRLAQENPVLDQLMRQKRPGAVVGFYLPASGGQPQGQDASAAPAAPEEPAQLLVFLMGETLRTVAWGEDVPQEDLDPSLPAVTEDPETGEPSIAKPEGDAPGELKVQVLKEGDGPEVGPQDSVTAQYTGVTWSDGTTFDASWEHGAPFTFRMSGGVIDGWTQALEGQKVGSRVLVSIPPELAYGEDPEASELGGETLVFVIDILHALPPIEQPAQEPSAQPSE